MLVRVAPLARGLRRARRGARSGGRHRNAHRETAMGRRFGRARPASGGRSGRCRARLTTACDDQPHDEERQRPDGQDGDRVHVLVTAEVDGVDLAATVDIPLRIAVIAGRNQNGPKKKRLSRLWKNPPNPPKPSPRCFTPWPQKLATAPPEADCAPARPAPRDARGDWRHTARPATPPDTRNGPKSGIQLCPTVCPTGLGCPMVKPKLPFLSAAIGETCPRRGRRVASGQRDRLTRAHDHRSAADRTLTTPRLEHAPQRPLESGAGP